MIVQVVEDAAPETASHQASPPKHARIVHGHEGSALNNAIQITCDARDENGGSHHYAIRLHADTGVFDGEQRLQFQKGPLKEAGMNGVSDEALLAIIVDRLEGWQTGPYRSRYNALALTKIEEAIHWLNARTTDRQQRGVEGTHKV